MFTIGQKVVDQNGKTRCAAGGNIIGRDKAVDTHGIDEASGDADGNIQKNFFCVDFFRRFHKITSLTDDSCE